MTDIIIVGAGPAGLTAAIYACRAGKRVTVFEAKSFGGQIVNARMIENYPAKPHVSGFDFAMDLYEQAVSLGAEIRFERVTALRDGDVKTVVTKKGEYEAGAVILATGFEKRKLGLPGEDALTGRGISYCATCDGAFFKKKTVALAGGSGTALEDALYLSDLAEKVYFIYPKDTFAGEEAQTERLKSRANVEILLKSRVTALTGDARLTGIEVTDGQNETRKIDVDGLFVAVGQIPENQGFASLIELDEKGYVKAGEDCRTNVPGIFTAGDNRTKELRQLVTAAADGAVAATQALAYLMRKTK